MLHQSLKPFIGLLLLSAPYTEAFRRRCAFGDDCWPKDAEWKAFNASVSGNLIQSVPSAAVCHQEHYDAGLCDVAKTEWTNSFWRTNQTGAYSAILWELGKDQCFINSTKDAPCDQALVPYYSVAVRNVEHIQKSVKFAKKKDLYLVVKNTGHEHLGRSSGKGSFSIWTHNLKGKEWHTSFVPKGAPYGTSGIPAVTLQAGEQWLDVYKAASEQKVIVVGGMARTVGAAGGWVTGGGHSPFAHEYGLGADNLLEINLVTADGEPKTLNKYRDPEYFWAVRGGGGSSWGVITSVTYKTHPEPTHIQVAFVQINGTTNDTIRSVIQNSLETIPSVTAAGYTGYSFIDNGFSGIFIQPNGTNENFATTFAPFFGLAAQANVSGQVGTFPFPSWIAYCNAFLSDPNIATNVIDASRLVTADVLTNKAKELTDLILEEGGGGFNFIGKVNPTERDNTAVHSIWKESRGVFSISQNWPDNASEAEKKNRKQHLVDISLKLAKIVGPDGGTYINEANPYEPNWQKVFWGEKYPRLLKIKRRVDPTNLFVCNRCVGSDIVYEP